MNNNRGNNRRRGRGSNRQQGSQQQNRIDSRARGNAPQLLEKYRKIAHDAHLNGDRVTEEYYLQFADHYFRVIADQKQRQEEVRQTRRDDRVPDDGADNNSDSNADTGTSETRAAGNGRDRDDASDGEHSEGESVYEPTENPFVRENRPARGTKPQQRKPRRKPDDDASAQDEQDGDADQATLDLSTLPPAISGQSEEVSDKGSGRKKKKDAADAADETTEAKPRRRTRRSTKPASDSDSDEALEAVN